VAHLQTNPSEVERHFPPLWQGFGWHGSLSVLEHEKENKHRKMANNRSNLSIFVHFLLLIF